MKLKHEEFVPLAPEFKGKARVNHDSSDCSGSSKSLLIERKDNGDINAYCFRCGGTGYHREGFISSSHLEEAGDELIHATSGERFNAYGDARHNPEEWPTHAKVWYARHNITEGELIRYGVRYCDKLDELFIPVMPSALGNSFISRTFGGKKPKYINVVDKDKCNYWHSADWDADLPSRYDNPMRVVICEDILSAIKASRHTPAIALLGVTASPCVLNVITKAYDDYIVFLDDDNPTVKKKQRALRSTLELYGNVKMIVGVDKDPKECSDDELRELFLCTS